MPASLQVPVSHRTARKLTRAVFRLIAFFRRKEETAEEPALPWQVRVILKIVGLFETPQLPPPEKMRKLYRLLTIPYHLSTPRMAEVTDHGVPDGPKLRLYRPAGLGEPAAALVYFHGGGGVVGDLESHDPLCRYLAAKAGVVVISVDYRLCPEHKFPAQIEDAAAALEWTRSNADMLGLDAARIGAGGDSAGAYLALLMASRSGESNLNGANFLWLVYPFTSLDADTPSRREFTEGLILTTPVMDYFKSHVEGGAVPPSLEDQDLAALPPALLVTTGFDPLRDEGRALAGQMKSAGVQVTHLHYPRLPHEFVSMGGVAPQARAALDAAAAELKLLAATTTIES